MQPIESKLKTVIELPSTCIAREIEKIPFNECSNIFARCLSQSDEFARLFPSDVLLIILDQTGEASIKTFSCTCKAVQNFAKKSKPLFDFIAYKKSLQKFYEIDPGNAVYFGKQINLFTDKSNYTFNYGKDEAFIYRKDKYLRTKVADPIPLEIGDRILPVVHLKGDWKAFYKPDQIEVWMNTEEKKKQALGLIQKNPNLKIISDNGTFKKLSLVDDPRGIHTVANELAADGFFFELDGLILFSASCKEFAPPLNVWHAGKY